MEFVAGRQLRRAWGGPCDPGWLASPWKEEAGCIWPNVEHGIYVDDRDDVWIAGNSDNVPKDATAWTTNRNGGDGFVLKVDMDGNFNMRIGGTPTAPHSNHTNGVANTYPPHHTPP